MDERILKNTAKALLALAIIAMLGSPLVRGASRAAIFWENSINVYRLADNMMYFGIGAAILSVVVFFIIYNGKPKDKEAQG